jgi:hypothetical protein
MRAGLVILAFLCTAVTACRDATAPERLYGFFALTDVEGDPVPVTIDSSAYNGGFALNRIYGRSLQFFPGDSARYTYGTETRYRRADGTLDSASGESRCVHREPISYAIQGSRILLFGGRPSGDSPVAFDTLAWNGSGLVQKDFIGGDVPLGSRFHYRKEAPRDVCEGIFSPFR